MSLTPQDLQAALPLWAEAGGATAHLINHSENHTFRLEGPTGRHILRVHRPGYQDIDSIRSELVWLAALQCDVGVPVPRPLAGRDGGLLQSFTTPAGETRHAVLFEFLPGVEPSMADDLEDLFSTLGRYAATLHLQALTWHPPSGFVRQAWNAASILDTDGLWGDWRIAPGVTPQVHAVIARATQTLRVDLDAYGMTPDRYGLIHADMRLGNLLVDGPTVSLIDFDDSGFCWFTYDFAASVSFHETHPAIPALRDAWLNAYQGVRRLDAADIASLDAMVLLRRMALLAWIGSHAETLLAQTHMPGFAEGTALLAERYLSGGLWR